MLEFLFSKSILDLQFYLYFYLEEFMEFKEWKNFKPGSWMQEVDVRDFIQKNYTPYEGDSSFLANATEKTKKLWKTVLDLYKEEMIELEEFHKDI